MMNTAKYFNETACEHNKSPKKACDKPGGGESCVFDGAYIVLNPIRDVAHLIHGPIACCGNSYEGRKTKSSGSDLYRYGFTTDMAELDIVFGSEKRLSEAIQHISKNYNPTAIFVYSTCVPALTGEDIESVCKEAVELLGIPVIPVIAPGFLGHKNLGNRIAGDTLLEYVIGTGTPDMDLSNAHTVNIIGEYNISGEGWDIYPLIERMGVKILSKMTGDSDFKELTYAHHAHLNLLVCGRALMNIASGMEDKYQTPYLETSFYGLHNTSKALRDIAQFFNNEFISKRTEELIQTEEAETLKALEPYLKILKGKRAILYTGGVKSWSYISALTDLGIEVIGVGTNKSSASDREKIQALVGEDKVIDKISPKKIMELFETTQVDMLIAGGRNQYLAYKEKVPFIDVNQEKETAYAGYKGLINMAEDLVKTLNSPVWKVAKLEAPWKHC